MSKAYQVCRAYESQQRGANGPKNVCVFEKGLSSKGILELNGNFLEDHPIGDNYGTYNCDADDDVNQCQSMMMMMMIMMRIYI